ncbi:MAG: rhodanese-like protein [Chitinophagaceae bacterium]|nr:rhodanese-like protein [Chitinophagaceae bacterium]
MRRLFVYLLLCCTQPATAQFKNDNVKYTTVFPEDLCKTLQTHPGYVLLDVRSQGEFDDTLSSSPGLNIGHIKDAFHISIQELPARWKELIPYKDKPLFIYCSHSQRSRRASRMLADSGFSKLFNVDGGLTNFYLQGIAQRFCAGFAIATTLPYKILSPGQLVENIRAHGPYFIIDLRNDSAFNGTALSEKVRSEGRFNQSVNIPFATLNESLANIPRDKPIMLVDEYGNESPVAAQSLITKGFKDVSILINGIDEWVDYSINTTGKSANEYTASRNFNLLSAEEFDKQLKDQKPLTLIDVRSNEEFTNQSKNYWENIGQVKNAISIPAAELEGSSRLPQSKNNPVIIYAFGDPEYVYAAAATLKKRGYKNVSVLRGGIWYLRWASHNLKGKEYLNDWVINVPEQNQ